MNIWDLLIKWAKHNLFVDEERALFLIFSALTNRKPLIVEGTTGAGKTRALKTLFKLIPKEWVVEIGADSEAHTLRNVAWAGKYFLYIPELQKFTHNNPLHTEIIKTITEGDDFVRNIMDGKKGQTLRVPADITPVMSIAYENRFDDRDAEFNRRVPRVHLSIDPTHINFVKKENARRRYFRRRYDCISPAEQGELEKMIRTLIRATHANFPLTNPFIDHLVDYFPDHTTATTSHTERYADFAEGFARLRLISCTNGSARKSTFATLVDGNVKEETHIMTLQDVAMNHMVFGEECLRNILGIPYLGVEILRQFDKNLPGDYQKPLFEDDTDVPLTVKQICSGLRDEGFMIDTKYVMKVLDNLKENWHVSSDGAKDGTQRKYTRILEYTPDIEVDWTECWKAGYNLVKEDVKKDVLERWVKYQQNDDGDIVWYDPIKQMDILLVNDGDVHG